MVGIHTPSKLWQLLFLASGYIVLGKISIHFATMSEGIAIAWLPNGLILALFLLRPTREWPLYASVIIPAEIIADFPAFTYVQAIEFALINIAETMLSAYLIRRFTSNTHNFHNLHYVLLFIIIALCLSPMLSAIFGGLVYHTQIESQSNFLAFWRIWLFGDSLGILLITPLLLSWLELKHQFSYRSLTLEPIIMIPLTLIFAYILFSNDFSPNLLPTTPIIFILVLLWMSYRRGLMESLTMSVLISMIAIYFTVHHQGPFSIFSPVQNTLYLQEFIAAMVVSTLFFSVLLRQMNEKTDQLEILSKNLENQVAEKTSALQLANQKLFELATTDPLTHIYNRRFLLERAEEEVNRGLRYQSDLSLMLFDIDLFKSINDTYGHHAGDKVLISLVEAVQGRIRQNDIFARIGGEEFVILMPNTALNEAVALAKKLQKRIEEVRVPINNTEITFSVSFGVTTISEHRHTFDILLNHADKLMYQAKNAGRNRIIYSDE
ncbi:diguanylate cyclase [Sulfuricurvum sp.]|uniref:sensor domain-containing diguanylate cyclase n=1 Tax=Sulfuricurvum sp. TaxID=2025608 RepID=UPI0025D9568D|nr:diguanylate cyclase [Sulfuricurvum sp.]